MVGLDEGLAVGELNGYLGLGGSKKLCACTFGVGTYYGATIPYGATITECAKNANKALVLFG